MIVLIHYIIITEEMAATGNTGITQYAVLCSEVLCKVNSFMLLKEITTHSTATFNTFYF